MNACGNNVVPFPAKSRAPNGEQAYERIVASLRGAILSHGGVWDEDAQEPKLRRMREILAEATLIKQR